MLTTQDRLDILNVVARYAHCADKRDAEGFADCFSDQGRLIFGETDVRGRAALRGIFVGAAPGKSRHCNMNHVIREESGAVIHECYVVLFSYETGPIAPTFIGSYQDKFEKSADGKWRIVERVAQQAN